MKKSSLIFISFILFISCSTMVNAASNPYKQTSSFGTNCTWYAWKMAYEKGGVALPGWGNAKDWYNDAKKDGYKVGSTPKANSIVVWGNWTSYGHVGYVESVTSNTLHVWDSTGPCIDREDEEFKQCIANGVSEETDRICYANAKRKACEYTISPSDYEITGYIYLDEKPTKKKSSSSSNKTSPSNNNSSSSSEETKSNNAYLKELHITDTELSFTKETFIYKAEVPSTLTEIEITATPEDEKAKITGLGKYSLQDGLNEFIIEVTAEDKTKQTYKIFLTRQPQPVEQESITIPQVNKKEKNNVFLIISLIIIAILLIAPLTIIFIKRKKLKK